MMMMVVVVQCRSNWWPLSRCIPECLPHPTPPPLCGGAPEGLQLVLRLQGAQFPLHRMQKVGAAKAAPATVEAHDNGAVAADQRRGPVHAELLRQLLTARRAVATRDGGGGREKRGVVSHLNRRRKQITNLCLSLALFEWLTLTGMKRSLGCEI